MSKDEDQNSNKIKLTVESVPLPSEGYYNQKPGTGEDEPKLKIFTSHLDAVDGIVSRTIDYSQSSFLDSVDAGKNVRPNSGAIHMARLEKGSEGLGYVAGRQVKEFTAGSILEQHWPEKDIQSTVKGIIDEGSKAPGSRKIEPDNGPK